ncbi:MAG: ABC transporter permease [Steroidobacteraceae bacterium]
MAVLITGRWEPLSQALRRLRRDWAFTAAFVVTLALGIAANAAVFSALDAYFLRPLPYPHGEKLVDIYFGAAKFPLPPGSAMSAPTYQRLRAARALSSSGLVAEWGDRTIAIPGEPPANHEVFAVTASTLETLDVRPLLGRWMSPAANQVGGPAEVDLSYGLWQSAFHGDPHALGRTLRVSGRPYTVVGVMPPGFDFPARHPQLWVPIALTPAVLSMGMVTDFNYVMIGRLRPGVSRAQLDIELDNVLARLEQTMSPADRMPAQQVGAYLAFMPWRQWLGGATRGRLLMMQLGAGILLLLAVASLVNLALARALRRRDEAALRVVLGAGRRVLLVQALLEALPLGVAATLIAWPLTELGMRAFTRYGIASASTSFNLHVGAGLWVLALAVALLLSSAALALPLAFVHVDRPAELLYGTGKGGGSGHRMRPLRLALSVGQIGLAIALLAGALLLGRSLRNMLDANPGFASSHLYAATLLLQGPQYEQWGAWLAAHQRLAAAVTALPGVRESGIGEAVPFSGRGSSSSFSPAQDQTGRARHAMGAITMAGPGLMKTLGVHLLAGRLLDVSDAATDAANVVIDERFADALFGSSDVVGKTVTCSIGAGTCRIVGVIRTIQDGFASHYSFANGTVFVPEEPNTFTVWGRGGATTLLMRSSEPPAILSQEVRNLVRRTLPDQTLIAFAPMHELISDSAQGAAALASLLIAFGVLAFTLAIIGTYGVIAYVTGLRRREFAVRQAVGAQPVQIETLVLGQGLLLWVLGTLVGVGCALAFARSLAAELYRVSVFSPDTYILPAVIVGAAVMLASWIPARGARKLDLIAQIRPE